MINLVTMGPYLILGMLSVIYFLDNYDRYLLSVSIIPYINYSSYQYSLLSGTVFGLCYSAGGVILALGSDASSKANGSASMKSKILALTVACMVFSTAFMLTGVSSSFWQLAVIRMLMGFAQSVVTPFSTAIIGLCFSAADKGFAFGVFQLGLYFSFSLSLSLGTYIYDNYGWQYGYILFGSLGMALSLLIPFINGIISNYEDHEGERDATSSISLGLSRENSIRDSADFVGLSAPLSAVNLPLASSSPRPLVKQWVGSEPQWKSTAEYSALGGTGCDEDEDSLGKDRGENVAAVVVPPVKSPMAPSFLTDAASAGLVDSNSATAGKIIAFGKSSGRNTRQLHDNISSISTTSTTSGSPLKQGTGNISTYSVSHGVKDGDSIRDGSKSLSEAQSVDLEGRDQESGDILPELMSPLVSLPASPARHGDPRWSAGRGRQHSASSVAPSDVSGFDSKQRYSMISVSLMSTRESEFARIGTKPETIADSAIASSNSQWTRSWEIVIEIFSIWSQSPMLYILCLATGLRLGAGYIWSTYTSVYFSELWVISPTSLDGLVSPCLYSYNETIADNPADAPPPGFVGICDSAYPFCMPASNQAILDSHDYYCYKISNNAWMNEGMSHAKLEEFMSWIPILGSALGNILGGILSDKFVGRLGSRGRALVSGIGNLLAAPFVVGALLSGYPACFLFMIGSGLVGETYLSQSIALLSDLTPPHLIITSVALFMFLITVIAGNAPLLVPAVRAMFAARFDPVTVTFYAAPSYSSSTVNIGRYQDQEVIYSDTLSGGGSHSLQWSLIACFISLYISSGLLYLLFFKLFTSQARTGK